MAAVWLRGGEVDGQYGRWLADWSRADYACVVLKQKSLEDGNGRLSFVKMNPAGNTTLLVTDAVPRAQHMELARLFMGPAFLAVEQVGYVERPRDSRAVARLQMMGGEFCGNASRALAALLVDRGAPGVSGRGRTSGQPGGGGRLLTGEEWALKLEVSGSPELLDARVRSMGGPRWWVEMGVPVPLRVEVVDAFVRVVMNGIEHIVVEDLEPSLASYRRLVEMGAFSRDVAARGVMFWKPREGHLTPLVVVGDGEPIWESSCGSGSVAVACRVALAAGSSIHDLSIRQPGGELVVDVESREGRTRSAVLKGAVEKVAEGTVELPEGLERQGAG